MAFLLALLAALPALRSRCLRLGTSFLLSLRRTALQAKQSPLLLASISWSASNPGAGPGSTVPAQKEPTGTVAAESTEELKAERPGSDSSRGYPTLPGGQAQVAGVEELYKTYDANDTRIVALYVSSSKHYCSDILTSGFTLKPWTEYWALLSTGEVYLGLPHGDPRSFDFDTERQENPDRFVRLERVSGSDAWALPYQGRLVIVDKREPAIHVSDGVVFKRVGQFDHFKLAGTYRHDTPRNFVESSEAYGLHGATSISFNLDGSFSVEGCTDICFKPRPTQEDALQSQEDTRGLYEIDGNVIEFKYDGGHVENAYFFEIPGASGKLLSINGVTYRRVDS